MPDLLREQAREIHQAARACAAAFEATGWTWRRDGERVPGLSEIEDEIYRKVERIAQGELAADWHTSSGRIRAMVDEDGDVLLCLEVGQLYGVIAPDKLPTGPAWCEPEANT